MGRKIYLIAMWALACDSGGAETLPVPVDVGPDVTRGMVDWGPDSARPDAGRPDAEVRADGPHASDGAPPDPATADAATTADAAESLDGRAPDVASGDGARDGARPDADIPDALESDAIVPECAVDDHCRIDQACEDELCVDIPPAGTCQDPVWINAFDEIRGTVPDREDLVVSACHENPGAPEMVFAIQMPEFEGLACATTAGSDFDTLLHVRAGDCEDSAAEIRCANDIGGQFQAQMDFFVELNTTYYLTLDGAGPDERGDFRLVFFFGPCEDMGCEFDLDCPRGEICHVGACEPLDESCDEDGDCPPGRFCVQRECVHVGQPCGVPQDCLDGHRCIDNLCVVAET